jgi:hypothetical protein
LTLPGWLLAALACAGPVVAVYLLLVAFPELQHSRFRHALWDVRDAVVDDILDHKLDLNPATRQLLTTAHLAIKYAPEHTMRSGATAMLMLRGEEIVPLETVIKSKAIPAAQQERLLVHYEALQAATVRHLLYGAPSGWLSIVLLTLVPVVKRNRRTDVEVAAKKELSALPRLYPDTRNGISTRDLACV